MFCKIVHMSSPAVSIIVASYNYEQWLPQALQSALDQHFADFELLVVDDGSTDGSLAVAQDFPAMDLPERFRQSRKPLI